jgi:23S rRNA (guanosine2251-2'-O)-methyltransferase
MSEIIYGLNAVREALSGRVRPALELLVVSGHLNRRQQDLVELARQAQLKVTFQDRSALDRLTSGASHQGVLLRQPPFQYATLADLFALWHQSERAAFFLLLDGITDPHNFGAILRSAEVAGCQGVIVARDRSCPVSAVVEKTAAGALAHLPLCRVTNLARTIDELKTAGIWCYGLAGDTEAEDFYAADLTDNLALVVGSEGKGLRPNIRKHCDRLLAIPMSGQVGSLNASVAAGIALFEVVRQRRNRNGPGSGFTE